MEGNFGIGQISPFISNTALFDGKEEVAKAYAEKIKANKFDNITGVDKANYKAKMARIIKFE
ncbi:MAG: hypothetical protein NZM38_04290 [Cytophagales bacterium]|nr:hypothetical protein [Cytophagales bacterium]MDW8383971.1 hypothetical protein [Flammeovirgaceae bacterium]